MLKEVIGLIISVITLVFTVLIPIRIMKFQRYINLSSLYMGYDFAHAFQSVIDFYYYDCECDVKRIPEKYYKRYKEDFDNLKDHKIEKEYVLHYQRRLLTDYFYELESCRSSDTILRKMIKKDWTQSEAYVLRILICMNKAVDENPEIMKDISQIKNQRIPKVKGVSEYLFRLSKELRNSKPWMEVRKR